jgi:hypothetical protein
MQEYIRTLYTENELSIGGICIMTGYTRAEVIRTLKALELVD